MWEAEKIKKSERKIQIMILINHMVMILGIFDTSWRKGTSLAQAAPISVAGLSFLDMYVSLYAFRLLTHIDCSFCLFLV